MSILKKLEYDAAVADKKTYEDELARLQLEVLKAEFRTREAGRPVIVAFEGWDASGKGGAIKRLTERLDPRGYSVWPIGAPNEEEKDWRNREHWDAYVDAAEKMFDETNTDYAPWKVIGANRKGHARLEVMRHVLERLAADGADERRGYSAGFLAMAIDSPAVGARSTSSNVIWCARDAIAGGYR